MESTKTDFHFQPSWCLGIIFLVQYLLLLILGLRQVHQPFTLILAFILLFFSGYKQLTKHGLLSDEKSIKSISYDYDLKQWMIFFQNGTQVRTTLLGKSSNFRWIKLLNLREVGSSQSFIVIVTPDKLTKDAYRRLQLLLRFYKC